MGKTYSATFEERIGAIRRELLQFLNPNQVVSPECEKEKQNLRSSLRSITPFIVESLSNEMARCAPKYERTVHSYAKRQF